MSKKEELNRSIKASKTCIAGYRNDIKLSEACIADHQKDLAEAEKELTALEKLKLRNGAISSRKNSVVVKVASWLEGNTNRTEYLLTKEGLLTNMDIYEGDFKNSPCTIFDLIDDLKILSQPLEEFEFNYEDGDEGIKVLLAPDGNIQMWLKGHLFTLDGNQPEEFSNNLRRLLATVKQKENEK